MQIYPRKLLPLGFLKIKFLILRISLSLILLLILFFGSSAKVPAQAASTTTAATNTSDDICQFFPQTNHSVCGPFLKYWKFTGGLAQYGYPISDEFTEQNAPPPAGDGKLHQVQYFQRARFEYHPEYSTLYNVMLGLLGSEEYQAKYTSKGIVPTPAPPLPGNHCQSFPQTGFSVCGSFLDYWNASGGLGLQGYPISNVILEQNASPPAGDGKVHRVQYFQRARFEEHLENQPPNNQVLLGLLGSEQFAAKNLASLLPTPASITIVSGNNQAAHADSYFANSFVVKVTTANGQPVNGVSVIFYGPPIFTQLVAGGIFTDTQTETATETTDAQGLATSPILLAGTITGTFEVKAVVSGASLPPIVFTLTTTPPGPSVPAPPDNVIAINHNYGTVITWTPKIIGNSPPIIGFNIYYFGNDETKKINTSLITTTGYTDTTFHPSGYFFYFVTAVNSIGESNYSDPAVPKPGIELLAPPPPVLLSAVGRDEGVLLTWKAGSDPDTGITMGYKVYRILNDGNWKLLTPQPITATTYTDVRVTNGTYRVSAVNNSGTDSIFSNSLPAVYPAKPGYPEAPRYLELSSKHDAPEILLDWGTPNSLGSGKLIGYNIYRWDKGYPEKINGTIPVTGVYYFDQNLTVGQVYGYTVRAVTTVGEGPPSEIDWFEAGNS